MTMTLLAVACGSGAGRSSTSRTQTRAARSAPAPVPPANPAPPTPDLGQGTVPTPAPTGAPAAANAVSVIRAWSDALRHGDVQSAARYFALPSVMVNGSDGAGEALVITIGDRAQAEAANASLPCGARLITTDRRGRYVNALFRLTERPGPGGTDCGDGAGTTARTNFVIAHGRIVEWLRAPDDPGDNGSSRAPQAPTPSPSPVNPQIPAPTV
jgi:hypothetical protein